MRKLIGGVLVGMVAMLGAVVAQQPPPTPPPTPEKVIEALTRPTAPPAPTAGTPAETSMAAVLARYTKMVAAGEAAPTPAMPVTRSASVRAAAPAPALTQGDVPEPATSAAAAPVTDTLEAIRADLQVILGRLEALVRKGGQ